MSAGLTTLKRPCGGALTLSHALGAGATVAPMASIPAIACFLALQQYEPCCLGNGCWQAGPCSTLGTGVAGHQACGSGDNSIPQKLVRAIFVSVGDLTWLFTPPSCALRAPNWSLSVL